MNQGIFEPPFQCGSTPILGKVHGSHAEQEDGEDRVPAGETSPKTNALAAVDRLFLR